jgi:hypothetical protein
MLLPRLLRCPKLGRLAALLGKTPFELRFNIHYCFIPLAAALCLHVGSRLLILTLIATLTWMSDYVYQVVLLTCNPDPNPDPNPHLTLTLTLTPTLTPTLNQVVFRTFRLDVVEFTRLEDGGVQVCFDR